MVSNVFPLVSPLHRPGGMSEKSFGLFVALAVAILFILMSTPLSTSALSGLFGHSAGHESATSSLSLVRR